MMFFKKKGKERVVREGGRAPGQVDNIDDASISNKDVSSDPPSPTEARLIILQITDVYTLEHLASFKTLLEDTRRKYPGAKVVSMLTGDFLSPYLLSAVDRGKGMMHALNRIPLDYLTWGNHEADIAHRTVCRHVRNFKGTWINSNMLDHEAMDAQQEFDIVELKSPDGSNTRKVGLVAVLSDDPKLYQHFKAPGAFGGATITDPWEALRKYQAMLESEPHSCDLMLPLQHLYVPDDHKTCENFDFPVILSGHDHHRVDEMVNGTRLLKAGMNAEYATLLEISWKDGDESTKPDIRAKFVKCDDWEADPVLDEENERAYDALEPLRNTELARVPTRFEPLSSNNSRGSVCTMGIFLCSLIRSSMNVSRRQRKHDIDAVLLMGGNVRGNADYPQGSYYSLEALEAEVKGDEIVAVVPMPGWLLAEGVSATHSGDPIPGWIQYDQGVQEDTSQTPPVITHVAGEPLDPERVYRVATKISDLTNGQSPPWTKYYKEHPEVLPPKGAYVNVHAELMSYFSRNLWRKMWDATSEALHLERSLGDGNPEGRLALLDRDGDGIVSVEDFQVALRDLLGCSVDDREMALAEFVHSFADTTGDGKVALEDFEVFCTEMHETYERDDWRLSHPKAPFVRMSSNMSYESTEEIE